MLSDVRLNQHLAFELQRRRVPAADGYINGTAMALWPRLQTVMDAHCESVRGAGRGPARARGVGGVGKGGVGRAACGYPAVWAVAAWGAGAEARMRAGMMSLWWRVCRRLRNEVEAFLTKASQASFGADKRKRERFLYNNYSLILTIISDVGGKLAEEEQEHFEALKTSFQEAG